MNEARNIVILTGAGVSAESRLATFRGPGELWTARGIEHGFDPFQSFAVRDRMASICERSSGPAIEPIPLRDGAAAHARLEDSAFFGTMVMAS